MQTQCHAGRGRESTDRCMRAPTTYVCVKVVEVMRLAGSALDCELVDEFEDLMVNFLNQLERSS